MILSSTFSLAVFIAATTMPYMNEVSMANQQTTETELQQIRRMHTNKEHAQHLAMIERPEAFVFHESEVRNSQRNTETTNEYSGLKRIEISLSQQIMNLIETGSVIASYPISSGKRMTPTPLGQFQVYRKQDLRISNQEVPYRMPNYLSFTPSQAYGIHALPYLGYSPSMSGYWHEALDHIGTPVSHGCVRLLPKDSQAVYEWAELGVPILIQR